MNYKHAPYIFVISVIASSLMATTAALSNGKGMSPGGGSSGAGPARGTNQQPQGSWLSQGRYNANPDPYHGIVPTGASQYIPYNPIFENAPPNNQQRNNPPPRSTYSPFWPQ